MSKDSKIIHKTMSAIKSSGTRPEMLLRKALWNNKMRYRVNYKKLPGKPDIVFTKYRVAVFCDGDFWHGHNWAVRGMASLEEELSGYSDFWKKKILRNVERDDQTSKLLNSMGWTVIRFWESDILKNPELCAETIKEIIFDCQQSTCEIDYDEEKSI